MNPTENQNPSDKPQEQPGLAAPTGYTQIMESYELPRYYDEEFFALHVCVQAISRHCRDESGNTDRAMRARVVNYLKERFGV